MRKEHSTLRRLLNDSPNDVGADNRLSGASREHEQQGSVAMRPVAKHAVDGLALVVSVRPE
jgi:hypothetical protein